MTQPTETERVSTSQGLVMHLAKRYARCGSEWDDLVAAGNFGLVRAHRKYDPSDGRWAPYASLWVRSFMQREISKGSRTIHISHHTVTKMRKEGKPTREYLARLDAPGRQNDDGDNLHETIAGDSPDPELETGQSELRELVERIMFGLSDRERSVVEAYFFDCKSLEDIGPIIGASRERARQIRNRSLEKMRRAATQMGLARELAEVVG